MYRSHVSPGAQGHICSSFAIETFPVSFVGIFHFCVFVLLVIIRHPLCWQNQPTDRKPRFFTIKYCNLRPALTRLAARYSNYPFDSPIFSSLSVAVFTQKSVPLAPKEMKRRSWHRGQYVNLSFDPSTRSSSQSPSPFFFALALTCRAGIMLFKGQLSLRKFIVGSRCVIFWPLTFFRFAQQIRKRQLGIGVNSKKQKKLQALLVGGFNRFEKY